MKSRVARERSCEAFDMKALPLGSRSPQQWSHDRPSEIVSLQTGAGCLLKARFAWTECSTRLIQKPTQASKLGWDTNVEISHSESVDWSTHWHYDGQDSCFSSAGIHEPRCRRPRSIQ